MDAPLLTPVLPARFESSNVHEHVRAALAADPALAGRVSTDVDGVITLTGISGGPSPGSAKERQRWEIHVRLRLAADLSESAAESVVIRWADAPETQRVAADRTVAP